MDEYLQDKKLSDIAVELGQELQGLGQQCSAFRDRVHQFVNSYKRNRKTLQHHMQLIELLEVPQLVDACARNGFHEEALELANFVNGLERRHLLASEVRSVEGKQRGGSGVVQNIVDDVHMTLLGLRQQLLLLLTEQSSLPKELQVLATLRKLDGLLIDRQLALERHENDVLASMSEKQRESLRNHLLKCSETRLQMDFLEARTIWLDRVTDKAMNGGMGMAAALEHAVEGYSESTKQAPSSFSSGGVLGPYGKVIEMLEVNRTSWFAVVTQFNALFQNTDQTGSVSTSVHPPSSILSAWIMSQIQKLLVDLKSLLPFIDDGASLRSVLEQSLFFASRMGQVGCDFSGLLMPLFSDTVLLRVEEEWRTALSHFKSMISTERLVLETDDFSREQIIPLYLRQDMNDADDQASASPLPMNRRAGQEDVPAPSDLLAFPPLAYLLNALLSGFNMIRECPILRIRESILHSLVTVLEDSCKYLAKLSDEIRSKGAKYLSGNNIGTDSKDAKKDANASNSKNIKAKQDSSDMKLDLLYAQIFVSAFLPHVLSCFEHIFPVSKKSFGKKGKSVLLKLEDPTSSTAAYALRDSISPDLCNVFYNCLDTLLGRCLIVDSSATFNQSEILPEIPTLRAAGTIRCFNICCPKQSCPNQHKLFVFNVVTPLSTQASSIAERTD